MSLFPLPFEDDEAAQTVLSGACACCGVAIIMASRGFHTIHGDDICPKFGPMMLLEIVFGTVAIYTC